MHKAFGVMKRPLLMPLARRVYPSFFSIFGDASFLVVIIDSTCHENAVHWIFRKRSLLDSQCWLVGVRFFKQISRLQLGPQQRYLSLPSLLLWLICHNGGGHRSLLRSFKKYLLWSSLFCSRVITIWKINERIDADLFSLPLLPSSYIQTSSFWYLDLSTIVHHEVCHTYRDRLRVDRWLAKRN